MVELLQDLLEAGWRLGLAYALAFPVGLQRGLAAKTGLRTFPLVALGACAYLLLAQRFFPGEGGPEARALQGLLSGIGFIGGGISLEGRSHVHGLGTAAGIWGTGAIGAAIAFDQFAIAILVAIANLATLHTIAGPGEREEQAEADRRKGD